MTIPLSLFLSCLEVLALVVSQHGSVKIHQEIIITKHFKWPQEMECKKIYVAKTVNCKKMQVKPHPVTQSREYFSCISMKTDSKIHKKIKKQSLWL